MNTLFDTTAFILKGSIVSLKIFIVTIIFAIPLGMAISILKTSKIKILKILLSSYTWVFRGTPLMLQLFFVYFGLPIVGIRLEPLTASYICFIFNYGAYITEIFRGGISSIDKGQFEACISLGYSSFQTMFKVIIPQAIKNILPPMCSESINLIKDSALVASIGIGDILRASKEIVTRDFTITPFFIATLIYLIITSIIILIFKRLEKNLFAY